MKKKIFGLIGVLGFIVLSANSQQVFNFDELSVPDTGFFVGKDGTKQFGNEYVTFYSKFTDWGGGVTSWNQFGYVYDTVRVDSQYVAATADHNAHSGNIFGISYVFKTSRCSFSQNVNPKSLMITNNEKAKKSILNGDAFAHAFTDGSYFKLFIIGKKQETITDTVTFFLADYTNGKTDIINAWTEVDLTPLGEVDTIKFALESTDTNSYGMLTPAYFCLDDLKFDLATSNKTITQNTDIKIYPNPATDFIKISSNNDITAYRIINTKGQICRQNKTKSNFISINVSNINKGVYFLNIITKTSSKTYKFVKN